MNYLHQAAMSKFKSEESEAIAILDVLFNKSVGIGDHTNILDEVVIWTKKLTEAKENIKILQEMMINSQE